MKEIADYSQNCLSKEEIGFLLKGKIRELHCGDKTRDEFRDDFLKILACEPDVIVRSKPLRSQGRCSFGRSNEGQEGIALFVPMECAE